MIETNTTTQPQRTGSGLRRAAAALLPALAFGLAAVMFVPAVAGLWREAGANTVGPGRTGLDGEASAVSGAQTGAA